MAVTYTKEMREVWEQSQRDARKRMRQMTEETRPPSLAERLWGRQRMDGKVVREAVIAAGKVKS